jgi:hypothetical protein
MARGNTSLLDIGILVCAVAMTILAGWTFW